VTGSLDMGSVRQRARRAIRDGVVIVVTVVGCAVCLTSRTRGLARQVARTTAGGVLALEHAMERAIVRRTLGLVGLITTLVTLVAVVGNALSERALIAVMAVSGIIVGSLSTLVGVYIGLKTMRKHGTRGRSAIRGGVPASRTETQDAIEETYAWLLDMRAAGEPWHRLLLEVLSNLAAVPLMLLRRPRRRRKTAE
jgi:hypothetical protein